MKKILSAVLIICMVALCLTSCASFSEEDEAIAKTCAEEAAEEYYSEYFEGKTISGVTYSYSSTSVSNSEFKGGKYIVTISLSGKTSSGGYSLLLPLMDIKYSITVKNGVASIVNTEYI